VSRRFRNLWIFSFLIIPLLAGFILDYTFDVQGQDNASPVDITATEPNEKTISPDEIAYYNWTLTNTDLNHTYNINVSKSESDSKWKSNLNIHGFSLEPGETQLVTLSITPPEDMTRGKLKVEIEFEIKDGGNRWSISVSPVTTKVYEEPMVINRFENPLPPPLDNKYGVFLLDVLILALIVIIVYIALERVIQHWTKKTKTKLDDIIFDIIRWPILILLMLYGVVTSLEVLDLPDYAVDIVAQGYFITLILVATWLIYKLFKDVLIYYGKVYAERTDTQIDDILIPVIEKVGAIIIVVVALVILLSYTGIDLTMLAVGSIVISMVIAFALQDTISNFFSGIYILTDRPFKIGDMILLESGEVCRIVHIGMRSTRLYNTLEHTMIILPNNRMANDKIVNFTEPDMQFRITIKVGVAYGTDPEKITSILYSIAEKHPNVLKSPEQYKPNVRFSKFGESSLDFELWVWIDDVLKRFDVTTELNKEIDKMFKKKKIEIPFPQRVVWMREEKGKSGS
jgi:small-conductance mechanosensitive channel